MAIGHPCGSMAYRLSYQKKSLEDQSKYFKTNRYYCPKCDIYIGDEYDAEEHEELHPDYPVEKISNEGGKGSGKVGHQKWMLAGESGDECPNCMMITDRNDNGKCILCGQ